MRLLTWVITLCCLLYLSATPVTAQSDRATSLLPSNAPRTTTAQLTPVLRFEHLTAEDGLAQNTVNAILQDRQGFLWFGTNDGLSRFDGYEFVTYKANPQDPNAVAGNQINALLEDSEGMIWIVSDEGGVSRFDPLHERFFNLNTQADTTNALRTAILFSIYQDRAGFLWFGGDPRTGLIRYDAQSKQFTQLTRKRELPPTPPKEKNIFPPGSIRQIREDQAGQLWLLTDTTVARMEVERQQIVTYYIDRAYPAEKRLNTFLLDQQGQLWIGGTQGLYRFTAKDESFQLVANSPSEVTQIYQDRQKRFWIGANSGLYPFDPTTGTLDPPFQHNPNLPHSLGQDQIVSIYQDRAGVLWIGTANAGVDQLDPRQLRFRAYLSDPAHPELLADGAIAAFSERDPHQLWLAAGTMLELFNHRTGAIQQFQPPPDGNGQGQIRALLQDHAGQLWLGMTGRHLLRFDPTTARFQEHPLLSASEPVHPGPTPEVAALYEDQAHNLWVVVSWDGLYQLDVARNTVHTYRRTDRPELFLDDPHNIGAADIMAITGDGNDGLWLGYASGSLSHYDAKSATFRHYATRVDPMMAGKLPPPCAACPPPPAAVPDRPPPKSAPPRSSPPERGNGSKETTSSQVELGGWVESLLLDSQQMLWLGTRNGLIRFDPTSEQSKRYGEQEGLPTSYVVGILEDEAGTLWLSTKKGLSHFDPNTERFRNYDQSDGLQGNEFLSRAAWRTADGELTFGGLNGFTAFTPSQIEQDDSQPPVVLTGLRLFNLPVTVGEKSLLTQAIWATNELTLGPDQSIVSFEFASLSYGTPQKNRYRYQLAGLESSWNEVDSRRRFATYSSLPAGNYTLRVQGSNADGIWSSQEVKLALQVLPPWWRTTWFRLTVLLTLLGGAYAGYSYRVRAIQQRNRQLEAAVAERTQALAESEARLRGLATSTFEAIFVHNQGQIVDANHAASELFGYTLDELLHKQLHELLPTLQLTLHEEEKSRAEEIEGWTADGRHIPLEMRHRQIPYQGSTATVVTLRDLSERKEIERQKQQVAAFQERERIGRDLHDNLGQIMGYLSVQAQTVRTLLDQAKVEQSQAALNQLVEAANRAHEEIRSYILDIRRPTTQPNSDFIGTLRRFLQQTEERHGLAVSLSLPNEFPNDLLSLEAEDQLLRIIQEAITNIQKHASVQQARLIFTLHPDELQVIISDEGKGFQMRNGETADSALRTPHSALRNSHFGLDIMRERSESISGSLEVRSQPGSGTQIIVRLPRRLHRSNEVMLPNLRVMLVDDHPLYLQGLRNLLSARGIKVVGTANDGQRAIYLARKLLPDLILMDVEMPICNGIEATRTIKNELPEIKVVMLTVAATEEILLDALKFGASGYLLKNLDADQFFSLLRDVMRGEMVLSPQLAARVLASFAQSAPAPQVSLSPRPDPPSAEPVKEAAPALTFRQQEVLEFIAQGMSNKEIAKRLDISEHTVKYHVGLILETLQLRNRYELAQYVRKITATALHGER